jgi:cysteinyl-tRNA synthetase
LGEIEHLSVAVFRDARAGDDMAAFNVPPAEPAAAAGPEAAGEADVTLAVAASEGPESWPEDPLALRLALLRRHYRARAALSREDVAAAAADLTTVRERVASWARSPSRPIDKGHAAAALDALDNDLDTVTCLDVLRRLGDEEDVAAGAKFETFAYLDRVLALDLAREVGKG